MKHNARPGVAWATLSEVEMAENYDPIADRFLREGEVRRITSLSRTTRWRLEREGKFPRRRQISRNGVAWLASEIAAWVQERSEPKAA